MLKRLWMVAVGLLLAGAAVESQAAVISLWSFDSGSGSSPFNANTDFGTQTGSSATLSTSSAFQFIAGTTLSDPRGSPSAGSAFQFTTGSGGSFILQLSGANLSGFQVTYAGRNTT